MGRKCSVPNCRSGYIGSNTLKGISFHALPRDPERKTHWLNVIPRKNWNPSLYSSICSLHFRASDYHENSLDASRPSKHNTPLNLRILNKDAIPSLFTDFYSLNTSSSFRQDISVPRSIDQSDTLLTLVPDSKESSPVPEETVNLSASMEVDKSVGIMLSSKQCIYLKRQFRKLKDMSQSHSEFLAKELKCPQDYISECFSLYKDYIKCQTETNSLLKSSNKDPLEFNEDELMKELEKDYEDFEVLNFEDETVRDHLVVVD
uniref:THAP domain containing, apoptosis associated protein 2 [Latimeria chalumnae] n=2 Tax=Lepeophtheirus salmonis TaxID=72036 RepID=A0A0K2TVM1_LEPSM